MIDLSDAFIKDLENQIIKFSLANSDFLWTIDCLSAVDLSPDSPECFFSRCRLAKGLAEAGQEYAESIIKLALKHRLIHAETKIEL